MEGRDHDPGVYDSVRAILMEQFGVDPDRVRPHARLVEDLGADPLEVLEFVSTLEDEFDLEILDEDARRMATVGDVVAYLERRLASAHAAPDVGEDIGAEMTAHVEPVVPAP